MIGAIGNRQQLQIVSSGYGSNAYEGIVTVPTNQQLLVHSFSAANGSSSAKDLGLAIRLAPGHWSLWRLAATDVDETDNIQNGTDVNLFSTTNNDGFLVQSRFKFSLIMFNVSQAETGSPTYTYEYYNGSTWVTLTLRNTLTYTTTGKKVIAFNAPIDWEVGDGTEGGDNTLYSIRVLATTAPSQAVQADSMFIGKLIVFREDVPSKGQLQVVFEAKPLLLEQGETLVPYFETVAAGNVVEASYQFNG